MNSQIENPLPEGVSCSAGLGDGDERKPSKVEAQVDEIVAEMHADHERIGADWPLFDGDSKLIREMAWQRWAKRQSGEEMAKWLATVRDHWTKPGTELWAVFNELWARVKISVPREDAAALRKLEKGRALLDSHRSKTANV